MRTRVIAATIAALIAGCVPAQAQAPTLSYDAIFTLPFARGEEMTVAEVGQDIVTLASGTYIDLYAPQHVIILEDRVGEVVVAHFDQEGVMVLDDLDMVWARQGDKLCAGDALGKTRQMRLRTLWGREEFAESDLSMVRTKRHNVIEYLSDARVADQLQSVLRMPERMERSTDINRDPCPYNREE